MMSEMEEKKIKKSKVAWMFPILIFFFVSSIVGSLVGDFFEPSVEEIVAESVKELKRNTTLPSKVDEQTMLVDITSNRNSIRYHYLLEGGIPDGMSNEYLRTYLTPKVCQTTETRSLIAQGVNLEYSYETKETSSGYFVVISRQDCE